MGALSPEMIVATFYDVLRTTRGWSEEEWNAATQRLQDRGWVDTDGVLTDHGRDARKAIEDETNQLSTVLWAEVGESSAQRVDQILKPMTEALRAAGYFKPIGLPPRE